MQQGSSGAVPTSPGGDPRLASADVVVLVSRAEPAEARRVATAWLPRRGAGLLLVEDDLEGGEGLDLFEARAAVRAVLACVDDEAPGAGAAARRRCALALAGQRAPRAWVDEVHAEALSRCERRLLPELTRRFEERLPTAPLKLDERERVAWRWAAERFYRALLLGAQSAKELRHEGVLFVLLRRLAQEGPGARAVVIAKGPALAAPLRAALGASRVALVEDEPRDGLTPR
jgi:hypothetical protein